MQTARRILTVIAFVLFLIAGFVTVVILPRDEAASQKENRALADFPHVSLESVSSGKFASDFETYLSDNVGYRSAFTDFSSGYKNKKGINAFGKIVESNADMGTGEGGVGRLLVTDDRVMEIYKADKQAQDEYIDMVDFYAKKLPESIKMYSMIIPTQIDFMPFYNTVGDSEKAAIDYLYDNFNDRVKNINVYDSLKAHFEQGEYVYFRTDHHWTQLGAYYAYHKMAEAMDFMPLYINEFEKGEVKDFTGYLYSQAEAPYLYDHRDTIEYYKNALNDIPFDCMTYSYIPGQAFPYTGKMFDLSRGTSYTMFLGGDQPYIEINTNGATKKTLLMLKDSYSNALIPWLASSYSKILVIDARTFDQTITKILNTTPIDDFLITNYILGTNFRDYIKMCRDIY